MEHFDDFVKGIGPLTTAACMHCGEVFFPEHETFCSACGRIAEDSGLEPNWNPYDDEVTCLESFNDEKEYKEF